MWFSFRICLSDCMIYLTVSAQIVLCICFYSKICHHGTLFCLNKFSSCYCYFSRTMRRKPLPKLVYNLLSDKELRKKNAEAGLPFHGDRKVGIVFSFCRGAILKVTVFKSTTVSNCLCIEVTRFST